MQNHRQIWMTSRPFHAHFHDKRVKPKGHLSRTLSVLQARNVAKVPEGGSDLIQVWVEFAELSLAEACSCPISSQSKAYVSGILKVYWSKQPPSMRPLSAIECPEGQMKRTWHSIVEVSQHGKDLLALVYMLCAFSGQFNVAAMHRVGKSACRSLLDSPRFRTGPESLDALSSSIICSKAAFLPHGCPWSHICKQLHGDDSQASAYTLYMHLADSTICLWKSGRDCSMPSCVACMPLGSKCKSFQDK